VSKSRRLPAFCAICCVAVLFFSGTAEAHGLKVGFADSLFASEEAATRQLWLGHAEESGAGVERINVLWTNIAPKQPGPAFDAASPADPEYRWTALDAAVREASAAGFEVLFTVYDAPAWAEGADRPKQAEPGSWKPSPGAFGEFAHALARRYDGSFPDPAAPGDALPTVSHFEAWNEPNLDIYLAPQWEAESNPGPGLYRPLLNHFFAAIKSVQPRATVVGGSLAPFGDEPGGERTRPVLFLRTLLCLKGGKLVQVSCPEPAHFDVLSDHPIAVGPPDQSAASPLDVTTPDIGRLTHVLAKAEKAGTVLPRGHKGLWVTEFWYDTNPPDPNGIPLDQQARWYEQDLYLFWKQGAEVAIALQLRDAPEGKGYASTYQSGAYFLDGSPKPSAKAFRFPFVAHRTGPFKVGVWGIAPRGGKVKVQAFRSGSWKTLGSVAAKGPGRPFTGEIQLYRSAKLRAVIGDEVSLPWSQN
jgi:hypothetical protein